jgi:hypothetical protein
VIYRLAGTLIEHGLVRRDRSGRLRLGPGVLQLARRVQPLLAEAALPVLRHLADEAGATAHLTIAEGTEAVAMVVVEPTWTQFHVAYRMGSRHPLERGAAGRAILAGRAGEAGVVVSEGELQPGAYGIAAAVLGVEGLGASVGVVALAALDVNAGRADGAPGGRRRGRPTGSLSPSEGAGGGEVADRGDQRVHLFVGVGRGDLDPEAHLVLRHPRVRGQRHELLPCPQVVGNVHKGLVLGDGQLDDGRVVVVQRDDAERPDVVEHPLGQAVQLAAQPVAARGVDPQAGQHARPARRSATARSRGTSAPPP